MSEPQVRKKDLQNKWFKIGYDDGLHQRWTPPDGGPGTTAYDAWEDGFAEGDADQVEPEGQT